MSHLRVTVYDGKYTVILDDQGLRALRYGEPWRDCCGDGMILALAQEVQELRGTLSGPDIDMAILGAKTRTELLVLHEMVTEALQGKGATP